jgi:hypothetical protein
LRKPAFSAGLLDQDRMRVRELKTGFAYPERRQRENLEQIGGPHGYKTQRSRVGYSAKMRAARLLQGIAFAIVVIEAYEKVRDFMEKSEFGKLEVPVPTIKDDPGVFKKNDSWMRKGALKVPIPRDGLRVPVPNDIPIPNIPKPKPKWGFPSFRDIQM